MLAPGTLTAASSDNPVSTHTIADIDVQVALWTILFSALVAFCIVGHFVIAVLVLQIAGSVFLCFLKQFICEAAVVLEAPISPQTMRAVAQ